MIQRSHRVVVSGAESRARGQRAESVLALVRDEQGAMEVKSLRPDIALIKRARLTGRVNCGTPIFDPVTREVMGYEIDPHRPAGRLSPALPAPCALPATAAAL